MTASPSPQALAPQFLVQFIRFHRGAREVTRTISLTSANSTTAFERAKTLISKGSWPARTDALRVMDEGGRTLIRWDAPPPSPAPTSLPHRSPPPGESGRHSPPLFAQRQDSSRDTINAKHQPHLFSVGEPVSYGEDGTSDTWKGGYDIVRLREADDHEPQYTIRSADDPYDRIVQEHELQKDLGSRVRGH